MVQISNKPNISGIKDVSEDAEYSSKLFAGLITTRFKGFAIGIVLAVLLLVVIPAIAKLCGC